MHAIACRSLTRDFGAIRALDGLTLSVPEGSIFAFLGPNGAGKTTTIHLLLGILEPTSGSSRVLGFDPAVDGAEVRRHAGALLEHSGLYERLSAEDNLRFYARIAHLADANERIEELLTRFGLWERRADAVATWSRGMKQKLAIARVLLHRPSLVFLDEPTAGLDPEATVALRRDIVALGTTVFLTTHNLADVEKMATHVAVIQSGRLLDFGTPDELRKRAFRSRAIVRTATEERTFELAPGESVAPIVAALVHDGEQIEEVRREEASIEDVFLRLVQNNVAAAASAAEPEPTPEAAVATSRKREPIFRDIAAVISRELRELTSAAATGVSRRATIGALVIMLAVMGSLGAIIGPRFVDSPFALILGMISTIGLLASVSDSFAGERERHTLETVLASAIPDEALLLGKVLTNVLYGWTTSLVLMIVLLIGANLGARGEPKAFYPPSTIIAALLLIPLMMLFVSTAGILLSLRAATVREAQARLTIAFISIFIALVSVRPLLPAAWQTQSVEIVRSEAVRLQATFIAIVALGAIDVALLVVAMIRFRRSRLLNLR
jgi:ABC-2 type transport system ATP-binding protein